MFVAVHFITPSPTEFVTVSLTLTTHHNHRLTTSAHRAREIACTSGPVFLLTIPPSVGYVHNPLSLYYCYELDGSNRLHLKKCVAEVTNPPLGERLYFDFDPTSDTVAKAMHVSPFMDMEGIWNMKATSPGDDLFASITIEHPHLGAYFTAKLKSQKSSSFNGFGSEAIFLVDASESDLTGLLASSETMVDGRAFVSTSALYKRSL